MSTQHFFKQNMFLLAIVFFIAGSAFAQKKDPYIESIKAYQKNYVASHEVVQGKDKKYFRFFPINKAYRLISYFERIADTVGFSLATSAGTQKYFYKYGRLDFMIGGQECLLYVYQGKELMNIEKYRDYLFVPFTDATTGDESYGSGRYIEFYKNDILGNTLELDFNRAYNPYCAYATGFKCPIPPRENRLTAAIKAGEMNFAKPHN
jgi:uncharacterized protein (DUF1684 family)